MSETLDGFWCHKSEWPDKGVTVRTSPLCIECPAVMLTKDGYDTYHESQEFECPGCGKTVSVNVPVSGDVL